MVTSSRTPPIIPLIVLAAFTSLLWAGRSSYTRAAAAAPAVPRTIGEWVGTPVPVDPRTVDILETADVALMEYRAGQEPPIWFAQVSGFGNRAAFHPPELCFVGSHFEILARQVLTITVHGRPQRVMRLVVAQDRDQFEAWYWFTAGRRMTHNYYQQQVWLLADIIRHRPSGGSLVRISTPLDDARRAQARLLRFVEKCQAFL